MSCIRPVAAILPGGGKEPVGTSPSRNATSLCASRVSSSSDRANFFLFVGEVKIMDPSCLQELPLHAHPPPPPHSLPDSIDNLNCHQVSWEPSKRLYGCVLKWTNSPNAALSTMDPVQHCNVYRQQIATGSSSECRSGDDNDGEEDHFHRHDGSDNCDAHKVYILLSLEGLTAIVSLLLVCLSPWQTDMQVILFVQSVCRSRQKLSVGNCKCTSFCERK